jgi:hypothetical protein
MKSFPKKFKEITLHYLEIEGRERERVRKDSRRVGAKIKHMVKK